MSDAARQRLQKVLADAGLGSRRTIETWISAGRITIDGTVATLGVKVTGREKILVDGRPVRALRSPNAAPQTLIYHKPAGELCTRFDPEGRPTIFDALPPLKGARWVSVGRLDFLTSGLLVLTTDGELAHALMHPSSELEREYAIRVRGDVTPAMIQQLLQGIELEDGPARCRGVTAAGGDGANQWYRVVVAEGRNRLVRRLWEALGVEVSRLTRIRFGPITLPRDLRAGRCRKLDADQARSLYEVAGVEPPRVRKAPTRRR